MKRQQNITAVLSETDHQTLLTHVRELQVRLLVTAVVLVGAGVVAYLNYGKILDILRSPLNAPLYYNSVSGSFAFVMKICLMAGIAVSVPLIVYNFIMFVRPAFIEVFTRKRVFLMTAGSVLAAAAGAIFGYSFIIPGALHFFSGFQVHGLNQLISADSYLNFVINVLITFVVIFQLPLLISLADRIRPISPRAMWKGEKWALVGSIIISIAVPFAMDVMTQLLIAAPIFILYNLSFVVVTLQHAYARKAQKTHIKTETSPSAERRYTTNQPPKRDYPLSAFAADSLAPHPQLAEVFAFQASTTSRAKAHQTNRSPVARPVVRPGTVSTSLMPLHAAVRPQQTVRSIDGFARSRSAIRTQPTSIIRKTVTVQHPQRQTTTPQMKFMSDIR